MDKEKVFAILSISETKDINKIKKAYREKLVHVNPEDDPEGFKALRQAYEEAIKLSQTEETKEEEALDTPVARWIEKIKAIYGKLSSRIDVKAWEEVFKEEVCKDFDTSMEAREAFLVFLMDHYRLPKDIWELILQTFDLCHSKEELYERFPVHFIDFVTEDPENKAWMNFGFFEAKETADIDEFIDKYVSIRKMIENQEYEEIEQLLEVLDNMDIYHPYLDIEKIRYNLAIKDFEKAMQLAEKLNEKQYDDLYISYYLALTSLRTGNLESAYNESHNILEKNKEHYGAKYILASYYLEMGEYKKAKEGYLDLLEISRNDKWASEGLKKANERLIEVYKQDIKSDPKNKELKLSLGWCYFQNDLYEECIKLIKGITIDEKKESEIYYDYHNLMGRIYFSIEDYKNAYSHVKIWLGEIIKVKEANIPNQEKKLRRLSQAYYAMAECLFHLAMDKKDIEDNKQAFEEAIKYIDFAIKESEGNAEHNRDFITYLSVKAYYLLRMKNYKHCIDICDKILRLDDRYFPSYVHRQEAYYHLRMAQEVIDDYYRAIEIYPIYPRPYIFAVKVFINYGQYDDAKGVLKRAEEAKVESNELKFQKLRLKMEASQNAEDKRKAAKEVEELYKEVYDNPGDIEDVSYLLHEAAGCYFNIEDYDKALRTVENRLKVKKDKDSLILKAEIFSHTGRHEEAIKIYKDFLRDEGYYIYACYRLGKCYKMMGKDDEAKEYFLKVIQADKEHNHVYGQLMELYQKRYNETFDKEDYELAVKYGKRQVEIYPHSYYYNGLGLVYIDAYEFEKAIEAFKEAIKCDETDMYPYCNMGYVYKILGNLDEAYNYYQLAIKYLSDGNLLPYRNLVVYYKITQQYEKVIETYEMMNKLARNPRLNAKGLAELYMRITKWDKAIQSYTDLYKTGEIDEMEYLLNIGFIHCFTEPNKALGYFKQVIKKYPKNSKPYYYMGDYMLCIKADTKAAVKYYQKAYKITKKNKLDYDDSVKEVLFNLLYALNQLGKQKKVLKYIEEAKEYLRKHYGGTEGWLKDPSHRKTRLSYLAAWYYFAKDYDKAKDYMKRMKDASNCASCTHSECIEYCILEGLILELKKDDLHALEKYERVLKLYPHSLIHQYLVNQIRKKVGNKG